MKNQSHLFEVYRYLKENGSITPREARREFGCERLAARIYDLKEKGMAIKTDIIHEMSNPTPGRMPRPIRYARYSLQS